MSVDTLENTLNVDALREQFENLLQRTSGQEPISGELAMGEILSMDKDGMRVDIGGKSEGFVPMKEIPGCYNLEELSEQYKVGQGHEFFVMSEQDVDEHPYYRLSVRRVNSFKNWDQVQQLKDNGDIIEVTVSGVTKGGALVNVLDLKGFIPASQIRVAKTLGELVGETLAAKILEVDKAKNKLILSNRAAVFETNAAMRQQTIAQLNEGDVVEGAVVKMTHFGVFIDIHGIDGLLPLSEISWRRIQHPSDVLKLGDKLQVQVLNVDSERQRISLSKKRLEEDPWSTVDQVLSVGQVLQGAITKTLNTGVLAELLPGIEAYCHASSHPEGFNMGQTYEFKVVSIHKHDRRITLEFVADVEQPVKETAVAEQEPVAAE